MKQIFAAAAVCLLPLIAQAEPTDVDFCVHRKLTEKAQTMGHMAEAGYDLHFTVEEVLPLVEDCEKYSRTKSGIFNKRNAKYDGVRLFQSPAPFTGGMMDVLVNRYGP